MHCSVRISRSNPSALNVFQSPVLGVGFFSYLIVAVILIRLNIDEYRLIFQDEV